jgi:YgiT-type zinc finger domain-containing protein
MCKQGEPRPGVTTVALERGEFSLVLKNVPALVCPQCGEAYTDEATATRVLELACEIEDAGLQVAVRSFVSKAK